MDHLGHVGGAVVIKVGVCLSSVQMERRAQGQTSDVLVQEPSSKAVIWVIDNRD